jgi:hypothetical protein
LRLIEQLGGLIRQALEKLGIKDAEEPRQLAGQAIGLALAMDPTLASGLSPQSLVSLFKLSSLDDRVIELVLQAIEVEATALESRDDVIAAGFRHEQANAVRLLLEAKTQTTI